MYDKKSLPLAVSEHTQGRSSWPSFIGPVNAAGEEGRTRGCSAEVDSAPSPADADPKQEAEQVGKPAIDVPGAPQLAQHVGLEVTDTALPHSCPTGTYHHCQPATEGAED